MTKLLPEFPTEWHQTSYIEGLEREADGYRRRLAELEMIGLHEGDPAWDHANSGLDAATAEHARVTGAAKAKKTAKGSAKK